MKTFVKFIAILLVFGCANSLNATNISGTISANTTWTSAGNPYIITSSVTVNAGITLTVSSGVQIQFNDNFGMTILGTVNATSSVFTSSSASPTAGKWSTINIGDATNTGSLILTSCQLSYGQYINVVKGNITTNATDFSNFLYYGIYLNGLSANAATANLTGGTFSNTGTCVNINTNGSFTTNGTNFSNSTNGFILTTNAMSASSITGGVISGMTTAAINDNNSALLTISNLTINGNCARGLYLNNATVAMSGTIITACTTPIEYLNPSSLTLSGTNTFTGNTNKYVYINHTILSTSMVLPTISLPYYFPSGYTIYAGGRLQISDDNILKFASSGINVYQGKLIANASVGKQIYFTSFKDDNLGGDANGDGSATAPAINNWSGIDFPNATIDSACILRRVTIKFADRGVEINSASPTIDNCIFSNNYHGVYVMDDSYPIITSCTFGSSGLTPIAQTFDADPVFTGNVFSFQDNQYDAIGLIGSSIVANAVLKIRSVTTSPNVTYVMLGDITIPVGRSLTINKGIVIKAPAGSYYKIIVQGALFANGTADSTIIMTSARDDNAGGPGDTNKDGTQTSPARGDFGGIIFTPGSLNTSIMTYCDIRFAMLYQTYYANQYQYNGAITMVNSSPTISNCIISNCNIGIMCYQVSNPILTSNSIVNSTQTPFAISVSANPTFTTNTFTNAGYLAIGIIGETVTANGIIKKRNVSGYNNITYVLLDNLIIANGTNVEIENGVVIKFNDSRTIEVNGGFKISGIPASRVTLTTVKDDNIGNPFDTNGDGNATTPATGNWGYISYNATSDDIYSSIRCVDLKYAGSSSSFALRWNNAAASIDDANIANTNGYAFRFEGNSNPIVDSIQILNGNLDPIAMSLSSDPTFSNMTFIANATKGIRIIDVNLSSNALLKKRSMAGISNIAYFINNLTIDATATLTIEAGVVVKSNNTYYPEYYYKTITVNGAIVSLGTSTDKIIFTSSKDDSNGGDYNNDGNNSSPAKNDWNGIIFNTSSLNSSFKNCIFRYGSGRYGSEGVITFNSANTVTIDSSFIEQSSSPAVGVLGSTSSTVKNTQFLNINNVPVMMAMFSNPVFTNITLSNVATIGLGINSETYSQNATVPIRNFAGYNNITYIGQGTFTVNAGTTINIPAGIVFKGGNWVVNGRLNVNGTLASPVVFTSIADDAYGNPFDSQQDGNLTLAKNQPNGSSFIQFEDISNDSSIVKNAIFRFNNSSDIRANSASPTIDSCTFQTSQYGVYLTGVSQPILNNSKFDNMSWSYNTQIGYPLYTSILSYPISTLNNTISGSYTFKGIGILSETLSQDVTLVKRNFASIPNIPYIFNGFTIGSGATLTIASGVVCKFVTGQMYVNKGLIAEGGSTADSIIVFTSIKDDFYGGDTNNDSNYTFQSYGDWSGIYLDNQAINTACRFRNIIVKGAYYGITTTSKSPSISNSLFRSNYEGLRLTGASNPVVSNCDFINNNSYGINNVDKSFTINAQNCWWGDNSGPTHTSNVNGTGDKITDAVNYSPFRTIDAQNPIMGDVSLNGKVQAYDAALVLQKAVSLIPLNAIQTRVGDVSGSAGITAFDASLILQYTVDMIRTFPAEELFKSPIAISSANVSVGNASLSSGETVTIPVNIDGVNNAQSLDFLLHYNNSTLEFISISNGNFIDGMNILTNSDIANGNIYLSVASTKPMSEKGVVIWLTFKAKSIATTTLETSIDIARCLANETDVLDHSSNGKITITNTQTGLTKQQQMIQVLSLFPNPFKESIQINYSSNSLADNAQILVYSIEGKLVYAKSIENHKMGMNTITWNGTNNAGDLLENGCYFMVIHSNQGQSAVQKINLIR